MNINIIVFVVTVWQGPGPLPEEVNNDCDRIGPLAPARIGIVCWALGNAVGYLQFTTKWYMSQMERSAQLKTY